MHVLINGKINICQGHEVYAFVKTVLRLQKCVIPKVVLKTPFREKVHDDYN